MKIQEKLFIVVALIASVCFLTYPVGAESGSILIDDLKVQNYNFAYTAWSGTTAAWNIIKYDNANYNKIESFHYHATIGSIAFAHSFEGTAFTISSGGSGSGYAWYDKNFSAVYYTFDDAAIFTSSPLTLSFTKNVLNNVTFTNSGYTGEVVSSTKPVGINHPGGASMEGEYHSVTTSLSATDTYNISYLSNNLFSVNVDKNNIIDSKYIIHGHVTEYSRETTFNKVDINNAIFTYADGLYLNATLLSGVYNNKLINSSGIPDYVPPEDELVVNPITGAGIKFNKQNYYVGDIANISWLRTKSTPLFYHDYIVHFKPRVSGDTCQLNPTGLCGTILVDSPQDSGNYKVVLDRTGQHFASFVRFSIGYEWASEWEVLDEDDANVLAEQPSYLIAPVQVGAGQLFNVTYLIGWTKTTGSTVWLRDYTWNDATNSYGSTYQPWALSGAKSVETNQSILVTKTGKHLLKLCDVLLGCKASTTIEAYYNGSEITTNVSFSNITLDKFSYSYGETMLVKVAVDNLNWSSKQIVVEYYDEDEGLTQNQYYVQDQIESIPLYISDLTFSGSGNALMRLIGRNVSGDYILATVAFSLSNVDAEGYGLSVTGGSCKGDIAQILVIVPVGESGNLSISADNAKYNKDYVINGTKTISYKYPIIGTYYITLRVNNEAKRLIIRTITDCGIVIIEDEKTYGGNVTATCGFWDNCVSGMFPGQGLNNVTRLLFSLFCIVAMMFFGMVVSKGNFGVSVILGFLPYAFFTYLTLSSPCGEYMPVWISIFIALIIGIKMKWFS